MHEAVEFWLSQDTLSEVALCELSKSLQLYTTDISRHLASPLDMDIFSVKNCPHNLC